MEAERNGYVKQANSLLKGKYGSYDVTVRLVGDRGQWHIELRGADCVAAFLLPGDTMLVELKTYFDQAIAQMER